MADREKVIKGLESCVVNKTKCFTVKDEMCPYFSVDVLHCEQELMRDALALLKEQEAVEPVRDKETGRFWLCGNCGAYVGYEDNDPSDPNEFDNYCRNCGRSVKWE